MKIRLASNNDLDFILNMYNQIWEERENNIEELRNIVKSVISNKDSDIFIVTINENDIATFTLNYRLDLWSIWKALRLTAMIVDQEYRSKWIWTKIMKWVEKYWKDNWFSIIELLSWIKRVNAHEFYRKNWYNVIEYGFIKAIKKFKNKYV